jgi:hypothetical protein
MGRRSRDCRMGRRSRDRRKRGRKSRDCRVGRRSRRSLFINERIERQEAASSLARATWTEAACCRFREASLLAVGGLSHCRFM